MSLLRKIFGTDEREAENNIELYHDIHKWLDTAIPFEEVRVVRNVTAGSLFSPATQRYAEKNNLWGTPPDDKDEFVRQTKSIATRLKLELKADTNMTVFTRTLSQKEDQLYAYLSKSLTHDKFIEAKIQEPHSKMEKHSINGECVIM